MKCEYSFSKYGSRLITSKLNGTTLYTPKCKYFAYFSVAPRIVSLESAIPTFKWEKAKLALNFKALKNYWYNNLNNQEKLTTHLNNQ